MNKNRIIYSIATEDICTVADEAFKRKPTKEEIAFVEEKIGDQIQWHDIIERLLHDFAVSKRK